MNSEALRKELVKEATKWIGTVETKGKDNCGPEVEMFQKAVDGKAQKEAWCLAFIMYCIIEVEKKFNVKSPLLKTEHCMTLVRASKAYIVDDPQEGDLIVWNFEGTDSGHAEIITKKDGKDFLLTIGGNTSDSQSVEREGDGVFAKRRSRVGSQKMKVVAIIRPF